MTIPKPTTVFAIRIEQKLLNEFVALCKELGTQHPRQYRAAFLQELESMKAKANERRRLHGLPEWEEEWGVDNNEQSPQQGDGALRGADAYGRTPEDGDARPFEGTTTVDYGEFPTR